MFTKRKTVGEFLFDYLHDQGIEDAFGIPGDFVLPTFRWLEKSKINIINMTHEPSVSFAADCYARSKGLGLAIVTYCVGGLNCLNGMAGAYAEKSPVIIISGSPSSKDRHKDLLFHHKVRSFETQKRVYEEVTCASTILLEPKDAIREITRVVEEVKKRSLPGYIEIPFDVIDHVVEVPNALPKAPPEPESDQEALKACIKEITKRVNKAKKPVIVAGVELHRFGLTDLAANLSKTHNIPIAATLLGKSVVRETNPLYIGVYSGACSEKECKKYVETSDCVIMLGAYISDVLLGFYSSKLERNSLIALSKERAQVGLHSYEFLRFEDLLQGLIDADIKDRSTFDNPNPRPQYKELNTKHFDDELTIESMFEMLSLHLPEDSTIVCDSGDALIGAIGIRSEKRRHFFSNAYYLSMGFAAPGCIGAMVANPKSRVFSIIGDGAFQMTGMELSTAAKFGLKPVVIIINNDGYGTQRHIVEGDFNNLHRWNYHKITKLLGYGKSAKVTTKGEFNQAIAEAVNCDDMYVIEVFVPRHSCSNSLRQMAEALGKLRNNEKS